MIQFIAYKREETNISEEAKKWFYDLVLNGKSGPFICEKFNNERKSIVLKSTQDTQKSLFK